MSNIPFVYRDKLNIPKNIRFGLELELDKIDPDEVYKLVRKEFGNTWLIKEDKGLTKGENRELVSPVLTNTKDTWVMLKRMADLLKKINPDYSHCSFQINFDGDMLPSMKTRLRFLKLYAMYEDIIYRFSKGGDKNYRESMEMYASPIILSLRYDPSGNIQETLDEYTNQKRYGIAFKNIDKDLIEFRTPNMTSEEIYWQNYINTFYYLLRCAANPKYDQDEVDRYIDEFSEIYMLESYEILREDKARQFAKTIFDSNIDKNYFMHQYIGRRR